MKCENNSKKFVRLKCVLIVMLIVGMLLLASLPAIAKPPPGKGKGGGGKGGISPKDIVHEARLDASLLAWTVGWTIPKAYDLGPDGKYETSDDGNVVTLSSSGHTCMAIDVQGRYIVWEEETSSNMRDLFYYDIGDDGRLGTDDDQKRTALEDSTERDERNPHMWGKNVIFSVIWPSSDDGIYVRNIDDDTAVKLTGIGTALPWGSFFALQGNGKNSFVYLGSDGKYGPTDTSKEITDLFGYSLVYFYGGRALYHKELDTGEHDWKYADVSWKDGAIVVLVQNLFSTSELRKRVITNRDDVAYCIYDGNHDNNFDMYLYDVSEGGSTLLKDSRSNSYFPKDMDTSQLLYTYSNQMFLYHLETGKHKKLA